MLGLLDNLSTEARQELRRMGSVADDIDWPYEVARIQGWRTANLEYHDTQRQLGRREMLSLMAALDLHPPIDEVPKLVSAATEIFLHTDDRRVVTRIKDGELRLYATRCHLYEHFLDPRWHGLTACGCFARRRGWYDAMGRAIEEELLMNRKWGDPVCQIAIRERAAQARIAA